MKRQSGFTLIELIMVIVILGILAATALPKFADLSKDARFASLKAAEGSVRSVVAMAHGSALAKASDAAAINYEGVTDTLVNGYPSEAKIFALAGVTTPSYASFTDPISGVAMVPTGALTTGNCRIQYIESTGANTPPTVSIGSATAADC